MRSCWKRRRRGEGEGEAHSRRPKLSPSGWRDRKWAVVRCTGISIIQTFMYRSVPFCKCYSFLLISNEFCDLSLLHWPLFSVQGGIEMCGGGGSAVRKMYCTGPWKLAMIPIYSPLMSPV
jgi:hypothetical protein